MPYFQFCTEQSTATCNFRCQETLTIITKQIPQSDKYRWFILPYVRSVHHQLSHKPEVFSGSSVWLCSSSPVAAGPISTAELSWAHWSSPAWVEIIGADFAGETGAIAPQSKFCGGDALAVTGAMPAMMKMFIFLFFYQTPNEYKSTVNIFRLLLSLLLPPMIKLKSRSWNPTKSRCILSFTYLLLVDL